jgi:hypothetical protein
MAFLETLFLPATVFGPEDFRAFRRFASIFLEETVRFPLASPAPSRSMKESRGHVKVRAHV